MKLIKIAQDHYIIVDDSEIREGDWYYHSIWQELFCLYKDTMHNKAFELEKAYKITHSTQPLEYSSKIGKYWGRVQPIELSEVKELIGEVDVVKKAEEIYLKYNNNQYLYGDSVDMQLSYKAGVVDGYNQALEDNKGKVYTEEDLFNAIGVAIGLWSPTYASFEEGWKLKILQSLQPKTEWEVEFVDGKLALKK